MDDEFSPLAIDADFGDAIRLAAEAFKGFHSQLRSASQAELKPLIEYLGSGQEIGPAERRELIALLSGEVGRAGGRRRRKLAETWQRQNLHERYGAVMKELKQSGRPRPHQDIAIGIVAKEFNYTHAQVRQILRDKKMRKIS
jgi:hypothetical protein